jgi:hypothetical protein
MDFAPEKPPATLLYQQIHLSDGELLIHKLEPETVNVIQHLYRFFRNYNGIPFIYPKRIRSKAKT